MRVLHTSDLHLGGSWRGAPRQPDQERVLGEILGYCDEHAVDLLLVAGDVFHDRVEGGHSRAARYFLNVLRPHLERGMGVFLLRGNHDPLELFRLMHVLVDELGGRDRWPLVVAASAGVYRIPGTSLQVLALPYMDQKWLATEAAPDDATPEEQTTSAVGLLARYLAQLTQHPGLDPSLPTIFTAHMLVQHAKLREDYLFESGYDRALYLAAASLPQFTSYNALGHIHLGQEVEHAGKPSWYSGTPDRTDLGERDYTPRVLLADVPDQPGGRAAVTSLPIRGCTPFVGEQLDGRAAVEAFCARAWPVSPLGQVTIAGVSPADQALVFRQLQAVAPRVKVLWARPEALDQPALPPLNVDDVAGTVTAYLDEHYRERPQQLAHLRAAFDELWSEEAV